MNTVNQTKITKAKEQQRPSIISLLQSGNLPIEDLPASLDNFFIAVEENNVIGAIGMEPYGNFGLLRSMVVKKEFRGKNIASGLVEELETKAKESGIDCLYLLTETASEYFERKGYERISRDIVPKAIQASSEFSRVCPVSAIGNRKAVFNSSNILFLAYRHIHPGV